MNHNLEKLYSIAKKDTRTIIGLMSGTSLDGLDIALCEIKGNGAATKVSLLKFETVNYSNDEKEEIKKVFSKKTGDIEKLCLLHEWIGIKHASIVNTFLKKWKISKEDIDLIASHGQTIYHAPKYLHKQDKFGNATLQIGDADHLAVNTGIITISDFRQKNIAAGGEGAPLAAYGDFLLFTEKDKDVVLINIGGISNFTYIPAGATFDKIICSDIGPGNTMMDAYIQHHLPGNYFDKDATIAKQGNVDTRLLNALIKNDFFSLPFPRTTGPELFNLLYLENAMQKANATNLPVADAMATLNKFTATVIAEAILKLSKDISNCKVYISGGGLHNYLLMDNIKQHLRGINIHSTIEKAINPDAKEAVLFAVLANQCVAGNGSDFGNGTIAFPPINMGKISFPV